jgi:hypothetical protein
MRLLFIINIFLMALFLISCSTSHDCKVPEVIGQESLSRVITGGDAEKSINDLHGMDVATAHNFIAYYGADEEDILYVTSYDSPEKADENFKKMIEKITTDEDTPFYHTMPLTSYENNVYMTIGMGAIHYIYISSKNLLWLQTQQSLGMELPENLLALYPVQGYIEEEKI